MMKKISLYLGFIYPVFSTIIFFLTSLLFENLLKNNLFWLWLFLGLLIAAGGLIINSRIEREERSIYYLEIFITEIILNVLIYFNIDNITSFLRNNFDFWWEGAFLGGLSLVAYPFFPILSFIVVIVAGAVGNLIFRLKRSKNAEN